MAMAAAALDDLEIELLFEGVFRHYGYDFREYARPSLKRRIQERVKAEGVRTVSGLQELVLHDPASMDRLVVGLSVNVSSMFRDPDFFLALHNKVIPLLRTYPYIRIWHAGCSTGEEVYSMAVMLQEAGLYNRCRVYATDMNADVLKMAASGIFSLGQMREYTANYNRAGGTASFSEYYTAMYDNAILRPSLKTNLVFAQHNLATDGPINEFHLILCRNVMIYFNKTLQARVHRLLYESLARFGFLGLGSKESLVRTPHEEAYEQVDRRQKLFRRAL